jgi:folate-binding protein YgfZ
MTGKDRQRFLNGMLSNEVKTLEPGKGVWALSLDVKGHIQADMKVYSFPDHFLIALQPFVKEKLMKGLDRYIISEDVHMTDVSDELALIQIIGPGGEQLLRSKGIGDLPAETLSFLPASIAGGEAHIIRLSIGYAVLCPASNAAAVLDLLDSQLVGWKAFDIYRIESGMALLNRDVSDTNFAQEARWNGALNFQKGCYLGQETMARIDAQGHVNRLLMGIESDTLLPEGEKLFRENKEIGRITSSTTSLLIAKPFALGYVRREFAKDGERVEAGDNRTMVIVRELPLKES